MLNCIVFAFRISIILVSILILNIKSTHILEQPKQLRHLQESYRSPKSFSHPRVFRCGDIGKDLVVNFVNRNYPDNDVTVDECKFRMIITNHHICQIRVDFVDTELMRPIRGECLSQQFEIEGSIWPSGLPPLCGKHNDQHFYIHLEQWSSNTTFVDFKVTTVVNGEPFRFGVWLTQIDCSTYNVLKAPEGCTQYFLGEKGIIKSFNFEGKRYLNSQNYQICVRPGKGVCGIIYEADPGDFNLRKSIKTTSDIQSRSGTGSAICGMDYLLIPDGRDVSSNTRHGRLFFRRRQPAPPAPAPAIVKKKSTLKEIKSSWDRYCGGKFSPFTGESENKAIFSGVRSNMISMFVRTSELMEAQNMRQTQGINSTIGFRLNFQQMRDCERNISDMVSPPSIGNLIHTFNMNGGYAPPLFRDELERDSLPMGTSMVSAKNVNNSLTTQNRPNSSLSEIDDDDKMWDYLANDDVSGEDDYEDMYEFF